MFLLQEPIWIFDLFGLLYEVIELTMLYNHRFSNRKWVSTMCTVGNL